MLTLEESKQYLMSAFLGSPRCPVCHHDDLEVSGAPGTMGGCRLKQYMSCPECGSTWIEVYELKDVELVTRPQEGDDHG
jgi:transcriptional regulator NrdR family protein